MIYFALLFTETVVLFLLSRSMSKNLSKFMPISLMSIIFLPGIIIHELAHFFIATILFVPVGNMEFTPRKNGNAVKLGSIEIAKTDPVRRSIIGFAPVFVGLVIVVGIAYLFSSNIAFFQNQSIYIFMAVILISLYLLFAISNTMFSSSRDMEGTVEVLIALLIILGGAYILGFRFPTVLFSKIFTKEFIGIVQKSTIFLLAPISIDIVILGTIRVFRK